MKSSCLLSRTLSVLALGTLTLTAFAQPVNAVSEQAHQAELQHGAQQRAKERQEIAAQRAQIQQRKLEAEKECWQRFAVESCLREVRIKAREQDTVLHERELQLNSAERQEKAAERLRTIEQKRSEKRVPAPVNATSRSQESGAHPAKSQADVEQALSERGTVAGERAAAQAARVQKHQQDMASRELTEAERSAKAQKDAQDKQKAAQARRASKANDIANRKGVPLPIPSELPKP